MLTRHQFQQSAERHDDLRDIFESMADEPIPGYKLGDDSIGVALEELPNNQFQVCDCEMENHVFDSYIDAVGFAYGVYKEFVKMFA